MPFPLAAGLTAAAVALSPVQAPPQQGRPGPIDLDVPCVGTEVVPGTDVQGMLDSSPEGARLCLRKGIHRISQPLKPKAGQSIVGEEGAVLNGAKLIPKSRITQRGGFTVISGVRAFDRYTAPGGFEACRPIPGQTTAPNSCTRPDQVFVDGRPVKQELSRSALNGNEFYLDPSTNQVFIPFEARNRDIEISVGRQAIVGETTDVTVSGLIIEKFANVFQSGAIQAGTGWTISDNEVRFNHGIGIFSGAENLVVGNHVHHNGQMGLAGQGRGIVVDSNEISYNNTSGANWAWEGGGTKWVRTTGLVVANNYSHHNHGPGLWTDGYNIHTLYHSNLVEDNYVQGIIHEISYDAVIRNNTVRRNGFGHEASGSYWGGGIEVWQSPNVEVYNNLVEDNAHGIMAMMTPRGTGPHGDLELENLFVHNNHIRLATPNGRSGLAVYGGSGNEYYDQRNNRFEANVYSLKDPDAGLHFRWDQGYLTAEQWQASGNDVAGFFLEHEPSP